jgi:2-aminoadipate transaminase
MMNADVYGAHLAQRAARLSVTPAADLAAGAISFDSGHAFPGILPDLSREAVAALAAHRSETLQYSPRPGLPELRDWIAQYLREDGVAGALPEHVLITNGAKQALELVCRVLLDQGDSIVVTAPTYFTAIPIFRSFGVEFVEIRQDSEGLCVQQLEQHLECSVKENRRLPKFIYDVPDFHNPTGVTMSRPRRQQLLQAAEKYGLWIVEDSPYRKVRFVRPLKRSIA